MNNYILYASAAAGVLILFSDQILEAWKSMIGWFANTNNKSHDHESLEDMVLCYLADNHGSENAETVRKVIKEVSSHCYLKDIESRFKLTGKD
tara:strand:+ start:82 stop:360 length:279 start_codon:yes stop_codon:yes gene_type:complete